MPKIRKIQMERDIPVYDITVENTHNFYANNIVVHNCAEIYLPTNEERTAVCCLSSLNMETYDEWKGTSLVRDLIFMLNNVLTGFIENAPDSISKAKYSAMRERAVGLGMMGFHSYLQQKGIPFESERAREINKEVFKYVHEESVKATKELGILHGECPDFQTDLTFIFEDGSNLVLNSSSKLPQNSANLSRAFQFELGHKINNKTIVDIKGKHPNTGWHNSNLTALAPNASSGILMGTSPSIEPNNSNAYIHETRAGSWPVKNVYLERLLEEKNMNNQEIWNSIITSRGSVQHLNFLSEYEKMVFKTAFELDQHWVVKHAADRGPFITQGQSVNLFFPSRIDKAYFNSVHIEAWKQGLKSLYYTRTVRHNKMDNVGEKIERNALISVEDDAADEGCKACEG